MLKNYAKFLKLIMYLFVLCSGLSSAKAQHNQNKLSIDLTKILRDTTVEKQSLYNIPVLIRGDVAAIEKLIIEHGGTIKFSTANIVSAIADRSVITVLNADEHVNFIDSPKGRPVLLNDVMRKQNNIDSAWSGYWPLPEGYDGSGVVIGILDAPFDYAHEDFKDASGNTRIKYLWDQNTDGSHPDGYAYGNECDSASIADGSCSHTDFTYYYSHGTGVAGVAASSGGISGSYRGVAPGSDLIFVSMNLGPSFLSNTVDAIAYVFEKADAMGKPCVINTSFGDYTGSHDGRDITSQAIAELLQAKNGRALVAAAGNGGGNSFHLGYSVSPVPQFTWFKKLSYTNAVQFELWADTTDFKEVNFAISDDDNLLFLPKGSTPVYNILSDYDLTDGAIGTTVKNVHDILGNSTGVVETSAQIIGGSYYLQVNITPADPTDYWRFTTFGNGKFDIWSTEAYTGYSDFITLLPDVLSLPDIIHYKLPDNNQTIVSGWQCLDEVIAVGSYVNRDTMTNYYGEAAPLFDVPGALFPSSSRGPTRDGRIKPDITATGARILTTASSVLTDWLISEDAATYISQDGKHYLQNGTSFASPVVTGIAALYLQQNPDAGYAEIKNAITGAAYKDGFTGDDLPDNTWGYGKANAFRTLTGPWGCTADDYDLPPQDLNASVIVSEGAHLQWKLIPNADKYQIMCVNTSTLTRTKSTAVSNHKIVNGLTPATTYACRVRAFCSGFGLSGWSDPFYFTTLPLKEGQIDLIPEIYPNPATSALYIDGLSEGIYMIHFFNITGEKLMTQQYNADQNAFIDIEELPAGMYFLNISGDKFTWTGSIVIE